MLYYKNSRLGAVFCNRAYFLCYNFKYKENLATGGIRMYDIIIKNGNVFDGTGNPSTKLDIGIKDGKIKTMGHLRESEAEVVIDANGLAVSPGFIDPHSHSDLLCTRPDIHKAKLQQGVTTELFGQDGISVAPVSKETKPLWQKQLKGLNGDIGDWPWESIDEYLSFLEKTPIAGNALYLVPHGGVRSLVMGFEERPATKEEMIQMRLLVEEGMRQGAVGLSSGLVYPPNLFSNKEELIEICKGSAKYNGSFVVHIRDEGNSCLEALDEVIDVARQSGVRLHISHFKVAGEKNRHKFEPFLQKMDNARKEGIEVTFDQYPYATGSTVLHNILPNWMHSGGTEKMLERLKDPSLRDQIKKGIAEKEDYRNLGVKSEWEKITISTVASEKNRHLEGKNMLEVAELRGVEPADAAFDLLIEENAAVTMIIQWGNEEDIIYGMKHHLQMVGSDGIFGGRPHPRLYGTYPKVLGHYVREQQVMTLAEGIRKMTGAPAQFLRLNDRGFLRENYWADIVIFNPETIIDQATYDDPLQPPFGISYVIVNGKITIKNNEYTGETAGMVIRNEDTLTRIPGTVEV